MYGSGFHKALASLICEALVTYQQPLFGGILAKHSGGRETAGRKN